MSTACSSAEALYFKIARLQGQSFDFFLRSMPLSMTVFFVMEGMVMSNMCNRKVRLIKYDIFMKREKIYLTFTFKG